MSVPENEVLLGVEESFHGTGQCTSHLDAKICLINYDTELNILHFC
jgi:hypothetical protein